MPDSSSEATLDPERLATFVALLTRGGIEEALETLAPESDATVARVLSATNPVLATRILERLPATRREGILAAAPVEWSEHWLHRLAYEDGTVGRLMDPPLAVFGPDVTVGEAIEQLRTLVERAFITYGYVVEPSGRLIGVLVFRELLFARASQPLREIMLAEPYSLRPETPLMEAVRDVLARHYPVYPVCDAAGCLLGVVRGQALFANQALELSAQPGRMVGVEREERLSTPWQRSLRFRHPWLQLNLLTAFLAAAVVGFFEKTINQIVALAVFLPVLAGQSGNTGCQALAVTLRGMTLGETEERSATGLVLKEAWLGLMNGVAVGVTAALAMLIFASSQGNPRAPVLALVVWVAMVGSCAASGIAGVVIPLVLKRLGADPATASSIFVTTTTDVASMGLFLSLATMIAL